MRYLSRRHVLSAVYVLALAVCSPLMTAQPNQGMKTSAARWMQIRDNPTIALPVFTAECWVKFQSGGLVVTRDHGSGTPSDWQLWYEGAQSRLVFITAQSPPDQYFPMAANSILPNIWYHIALVVDGPGGWAKLYVNGALRLSPTFTPRFFNASTGLAWGGYYNNASGAYLTGTFDECRYWNRARSASEILSTRDRRLAASERSGLMGYWMFCGNFADSSGNGNDGQAMGPPQIVDITELPFEVGCMESESRLRVEARPFRILCESERPTSQLLWIHNTGSGTLIITEAYIVGPDAAAFRLQSPTSIPPALTVPPRDSVAIDVVYDPAQLGSHFAELRLINSSAVTPVYTVALYGFRQNSHLTTHDVDVGQLTSIMLPKDTTILLVNDGNTDVTVTSAQYVNPPVTLLTPLPILIKAGDTLRFRIRLTAAVEDTVVTQVLFRYSPSCDSAMAGIHARIKNTGRLRTLDTLHVRLNRCRLDTGVVVDTSVLVHNTATRAVEIQSLTTVPDSVATVHPKPVLPVSVASGDVFVVPLRIRPARFGTQHATLTIRSDAPEQPERDIILEIDVSRRSDLLIADVDFGTLDTSDFPAVRECRVTNTSADTVTISAAHFQTGRAFRVVSGLPVTLAPGGRAIILLAFDMPGSDSTYVDTLRLIAHPVCDTATVAVRGRFSPALLVEYPKYCRIDLAYCEILAKDTTIRISNNGRAELIILGVSIVPASTFSVPSTLVFPIRIRAGEVWSLPLRFDPVRYGLQHATLTLRTNDSRMPTIEIDLLGSSRGTSLYVTPLQFGSIGGSEFPARATLTISNLGQDTVRVDSISFMTHRYFTVESTLPIFIPPTSSRDLTIRFDRPVVPGVVSDSFIVHHTPACGTVRGALRATYRGESAWLHPDSLHIGGYCAGRWYDTCVVLENTGSTPRRLVSARIDGDTVFSIQSTFPRTVPGLARDTLLIRVFAPGDGDYRSTLLVFSDDSSEAALRITLTATVRAAHAAALDVRFDTVRAGAFPRQAALRVANTGVVDISIHRVRLAPAAPFRLITPLPVAVPAGEYRELMIEFRDPGYAGAYADTAHLDILPLCEPLRAAITGTARRDAAFWCADSLRFPALGCAAVAADSALVLHTLGDTVVLASAWITGDAAFSLAPSPSLPAVIAPGDSLALHVRYNSAQSGRHTAAIHLHLSRPTDTSFVLPLAGRRDSVGAAAGNIDFGTVVRARFPAADSADIANTGTVPLLFTRHTFQRGGVFTLLTPLPLYLDSGGRAMVALRCADPLLPGLTEDTLVLYSDALCEPLRIPLAVMRGSTSAIVAAACVFPTLLCNVTADTLVTLRNSGAADAVLAAVWITDGAAFRLATPFVRQVLAPGAEQNIHVIFAATGTGSWRDTLCVLEEESGDTVRIALAGVRESAALDAPILAFGRLGRNSFPARASCHVRNTGTVPIRITGLGGITAHPIMLRTPLPLSIAPGDSSMIAIDFLTYDTPGQYTHSLTMETDPPLCNPAVIHVTARRPAEVILKAGDVAGAPGDIVVIPLSIHATGHTTLASITALHTRITFRKSLLAPLAGRRTLLSDDTRIVECDGLGGGGTPSITDSMKVFTVFDSVTCVATLGTDTTTTIEFEGSIVSGIDVDIIEVPGRFVLTGVCREGGSRLFHDAGALQLKQNSPNPFNPRTRIGFHLIERGRTQLRIHDMFGREVVCAFDSDAMPGDYSVDVDFSRYPSGFYVYSLTTPTARLSRRMLLAR